MDPIRENSLLINRRHFFGRTAAGIGPIPLRAPVRWRGSTASI
jgi:hypothetical protein